MVRTVSFLTSFPQASHIQSYSYTPHTPTPLKDIIRGGGGGGGEQLW